jgi:two-component system, cell cycle sensor histidine kinase and response regulator CckA
VRPDARKPAKAARTAVPPAMDLVLERAMLAPLLDVISALVVVLDREGRIVRFNPASEELSGYRFDEVKDRVFWDCLLPPGAVERVRAGFLGMLAGNAWTRGENEWRTKQGEVRLTRWSNTVVRNAAGEVEYVLATGLDVTAQQQAQKALQDSEGRYRGLYESIRDAFALVDMTGRLREFNEVFREMLGYGREELLAMTYRDLTPERWHAFESGIVERQVLTRGYSEVYEKEYRRKDGTIFPVELRAVLLRDDAGTPTGMWATVRDTSARLQAERTLRESEAQYRAVVDHASDGIVITEGKSHSLLEVNPRVCEMLGYTREELLRMTVPQLIEPSDLGGAPVGVGELRDGRPLHQRRRLVRKDGTAFVAEIGARVLPDGRLISILRDVSEHERAEEALRQSEARLRMLFERASDGILISDAGTDAFVEANPRACEMLGYTPEELLGMTVQQLNDPEDLAAHPLQVEALRRGESVHSVRRLARKDGIRITAEVGTRLLPDGRIMAILRDVSERERAEDTVRESEARYRAVVEQASDGITINDAQWRFLDVNPRFCELLGYDREELLRMSVPDLGVREDLEREPLHDETLLRGRAILTERAVRRKDGSVITLEVSARGLVDGTIVSVVRDITERKRADQALRESEERFRSVFDSDMLGMVFGLQGGKVLDANDYFLRLLGYTREDLHAGRLRWDAIMPPESAPILAEIVRQARAAISSRPAETEFIRKDGTRVPVLCGAAFIGQSRDFGVGFALDLTELRRTEQRLAESERYLERAQALAHIGTWDADLSTMTAYYSSEMLRIHGLPSGRHLTTYDEFISSIHPDDRAQVEASIRQSMHEPGERSFEHRVLRADGTVRLVEAMSESVLDETGRPVRIIGMVRDVTERRFLEAQLREAQRLESIGRLAGGVAHDFNNLLTVILGFSETLLEGLPAGDERRATAEQIRTAGRRAADLTQQLLAFGRRQVFRMQVFDLNSVATEMQDILQRLVGEQVRIVISPDARQSLIKADRGQIEQVILNLALNARDAMPEGGRLKIATRDAVSPAGAAGGPTGPCVELVVSDTGTGMTEEVQAHIFEPFFTTKQVGQGTGLGLATVHGIVNQSGGRIVVESAPGKGATFRVSLPCAEEEGGAVDAEPAPAPSGARAEETVLLVEDEGAVRNLVAALLRRRDYRVLECADGDEAIDTAHRYEGPIQLLITDIAMPGMNGRELARFLTHERQGLRVLFISGYSDQRLEPRDSQDVPEAFLQKPFTPAALTRLVRQLLDAPARGGAEGPGGPQPPG